MKELIPDVLADRYASGAMVWNWSPKNKVILERNLWLSALRAQQNQGRAIPEQVLDDYFRVLEIVDLNSIAERELKTRHDVKARIEEFNALAGGHEFIHQGFTSRDATESVEQTQIYRGLEIIRNRTVALLYRLQSRIAGNICLNMCGRSHFVPGQATTLGKRFANSAQEILVAFERLEYLLGNYYWRGIKGPMGTQQDMLELLKNPRDVEIFEDQVRDYLDMPYTLTSTGQVYPRSLDFEVLSVLLQLASGPANLAKSIRLMAGLGLLHEGFGKEQSGSTAMPHKINSRTCERVGGLKNVLAGFVNMTESLLGDQWLEGDVSCSVVRRVALPGAFFAMDGILESMMTVLDEMEIFPDMVTAELDYYQPFLSTSKILMAMVQTGMGRETAHKIIKTHAIAATTAIRKGKPNTFLDRLCEDPEFPLSRKELKEIALKADVGRAVAQAGTICDQIGDITRRFDGARNYNPEPIR